MARTACRKKLKRDFTPGASPDEQIHPKQGNDFPTQTAPKHRANKNIATRLLAQSIKFENRKMKHSTTNHTEKKQQEKRRFIKQYNEVSAGGVILKDQPASAKQAICHKKRTSLLDGSDIEARTQNVYSGSLNCEDQFFKILLAAT